MRHQSRGVINVLDNVDLVPSNVRFSHQEALLYVFEDNEAVIKMIIKGRSPTMRHVSRTHRVALDWLFDRINLDPKIQIKYIDTKNQLADMLTKGNFTRDEWNHLLCLFNISHFSSAECSEVMSKRTQKESGEERVTAKSRPMMSLIARSIERPPSALSSTASESPGKTRQESQSPLSAQAEMYDRTGKPVVCRDTSHERHRLVEKAHSSSYSEWNIDKTWSSQEWKSDELMDDRTERPVVCPQGGAHTSQTRFSREHKNVILEEEENHDRTGRPVVCPQRGAPQHFVIEDDEAESDLSLGSRSFLHRVNDQVRKRQKQSSMDATEDSEEHSVIWECSCLQHCKHLYSWWRITQTIGIPSRIQKISQWNRCSTYLKNWCPNNQMRSMEWRQLTGKTLHGSICLWLVMNKSSVFSAQKSTYFQILYCVLVRYTRTLPIKHCMGRKIGVVQKFTGIQKLWTELMVSQLNSSGIFSQDSPHCSSATKFKSYCWDWVKHQKILQDELSSCRCSTTSHVDERQQERMRIKCSTRFSICKEDSEQDNGHSRSWFREKVVFYQWR